VVLACGVVLFVVDAVRARLAVRWPAAMLWNAGTLEWRPVRRRPHSNFLTPRRSPDVSRCGQPADQPIVVGLPHRRARPCWSRTSSTPSPTHRLVFHRPSIWPFLTAIATTILFVWSIFTPWGVVYGALPLS
jgi:cytochrome c oxidase subunit 1